MIWDCILVNIFFCVKISDCVSKVSPKAERKGRTWAVAATGLRQERERQEGPAHAQNGSHQLSDRFGGRIKLLQSLPHFLFNEMTAWPANYCPSDYPVDIFWSWFSFILHAPPTISYTDRKGLLTEPAPFHWPSSQLQKAPGDSSPKSGSHWLLQLEEVGQLDGKPRMQWRCYCL